MNIPGKLEKIISPIQSLVSDESKSSYLLLFTTVTALIIANSPLRLQYESLVHIPMGFHIGDWFFEKSLKHWVNDGLMALFFYVLGLEIKRELLVGELRHLSRSMIVIVAALGGMTLPAVIYVAFNFSAATVDGWGIPMATDTAFAVGVLVLLKSRAPAGLAAFLTALAIIDDLGAVLVIALFYTKTIHTVALLGAVGVLLLLALLNYTGVRRPSVYVTVGIVLWFMLEYSGVHSTIAGVAVALTTPARPEHSDNWLIRRIEWLLELIKIRSSRGGPELDVLADEEQHKLAEQVKESAQRATTPLKRWERSLERPVILLVLPIFALMNAGIALDHQVLTAIATQSTSWGIITGLVLGKPLGITLFCWLGLKSGHGRLPGDISLNHIFGMAMLSGIGFTMSIFFAGLSFTDEVTLTSAKLSIFIASIVSGILGYCWLRFVVPGKTEESSPSTA
jgi:NhaA family Na+:H+ antiporter